MYKNDYTDDISTHYTPFVTNETNEIDFEEYDVNEATTDEVMYEKAGDFADEHINEEEFGMESPESFFESEWSQLKEFAVDISAGANGSIYITGGTKKGSDYQIKVWNGTSFSEMAGNGGGVRIAVAPEGNPWIINSSQEIYRIEGTTWKKLPGTATDIAIGADYSVWAIGADKTGPDYGIYKWNGSSWEGEKNVAATRIAVAPDGNPWVINSAGKIFHRVSGTWQNVPGPALCRDIGVGVDNSVWVIGGDKDGLNQRIHLWIEKEKRWQQTTDGAAITITVLPNGVPLVINSAGNIFKQVLTSPLITPNTIVDEIAILPFNFWDQLLLYGSFLTATELKNKTKTNKTNLANYGISLSVFRAQLSKYVQLTYLEQQYKKANPSFTESIYGPTFNEALTEAVHQFQLKCYLITGDQDGVIGSSTLDSLGFIFHNKRSKFTPKKNVKSVMEKTELDEKIKKYALDIGMPPSLKNVSGKNWFDYFVTPSIWGCRGKSGRGFHVLFILKLRESERHLFAIKQSATYSSAVTELIKYNSWLQTILPTFNMPFVPKPGSTPRYLGLSMGLNENHGDARAEPVKPDTSDANYTQRLAEYEDALKSRSFHYTGMAIDINYVSNPWVRNGTGIMRLREAARYADNDVTFKTHLLNDGAVNTNSSAQEYFAHLGQYSTSDIFTFLSLLSNAFVAWKKSTGNEKDTVNWGASRRTGGGFLHLDKDLITVLRDTCALAWGTLDFGTGDEGNGDMMHIDMRTLDIGKEYLKQIGRDISSYEAYLSKVHPAYKRSGATQIEIRSNEMGLIDAEVSWIEKISGYIHEFSFWSLRGPYIMLYLPSLVQKGEKDPFKLTDRLFYDVVHSNRKGFRIDDGDPNYRKHWDALFNYVVTPFLLLSGRAIKSLQGNLIIPNGSNLPTLLMKNQYGLVLFPLSGPGFARYTSNFDDTYTHPITGIKGKHGDNWIDAQTAADFYNAIQDFRATTEGQNVIIHYGDVSAYDPSINLGHKTHNLGRAVDIHYFGSAGEEFKGNTAYKNGDVKKVNAFLRIVQNYGFASNYSYGKRYTHAGSNNHSDHKDHFHIGQTTTAPQLTQPETEYEQMNETMGSISEAENEILYTNEGAELRDENAVSQEDYEDYFYNGNIDELHRDESLENESYFEAQELETVFEQEAPPPSLDVNLMHDDLLSSVSQREIIGLDGGKNINIKLSTSVTDGVKKDSIRIKLVFRVPGSIKKIHEETVLIPKIGTDPADSTKLIFRKSTPLKNFGKMLSADRINEIATIRRDKGTSDGKLIAALAPDWQLRGRGVQSPTCGTFSDSWSNERPDALQLLKAGGVAIMELIDLSGTIRVKRYVRNPADIFYYSGHGIGVGYSKRASISPPWNCLVIHDEDDNPSSPYGYCCWAKPADLIANWKSPMDLDAFIIAGCAVLGVDGSKTPLTGDGVEWSKLLYAKGGPLLFLLGYGDWDPNERSGPHGSSAPSDINGGDDIAERIGKWIKAQPKNLNGIIKQWLLINMMHENQHGVGMDKEGNYWRTRRRPPSPTPKATPGWILNDTQTITTLPGNTMTFVIEHKKV